MLVAEHKGLIIVLLRSGLLIHLIIYLDQSLPLAASHMELLQAVSEVAFNRVSFSLVADVALEILEVRFEIANDIIFLLVPERYLSVIVDTCDVCPELSTVERFYFGDATLFVGADNTFDSVDIVFLIALFAALAVPLLILLRFAVEQLMAVTSAVYCHITAITEINFVQVSVIICASFRVQADITWRSLG